MHNFNLTPCLPPGCKGAGPQGSKGAALAPKWPKPKPKWLLSHSLSLTRLEGEPPQGTPAGTSSTGLGGQFWPPGRMGLVWAAAGVGHLHPRSQVHWYVRVGSLSSSTRSKGEPTSDNSPSRAGSPCLSQLCVKAVDDEGSCIATVEPPPRSSVIPRWPHHSKADAGTVLQALDVW